MPLADKMFSRNTKTCPIRSDCRSDSDKRYFESLFERNWEVFVIKRNSRDEKFDWFTLCCETADELKNGECNSRSAAGC